MPDNDIDDIVKVIRENFNRSHYRGDQSTINVIYDLKSNILFLREFIDNAKVVGKKPSVYKKREDLAIKVGDLYVSPTIFLESKPQKVKVRILNWFQMRAQHAGKDNKGDSIEHRLIPHALSSISTVCRAEVFDPGKLIYESIFNEHRLNKWEELVADAKSEAARQQTIAVDIAHEYRVKHGARDRKKFTRKMTDAIMGCSSLRGKSPEFLLQVMRTSYDELMILSKFAKRNLPDLEIVEIGDIEEALLMMNVQEVVNSL